MSSLSPVGLSFGNSRSFHFFFPSQLMYCYCRQSQRAEDTCIILSSYIQHVLCHEALDPAFVEKLVEHLDTAPVAMEDREGLDSGPVGLIKPVVECLCVRGLHVLDPRLGGHVKLPGTEPGFGQ